MPYFDFTFSIIVPVFNVEKFIIEALESILNQSFTFFEVIAVNDASTDNSLSILQDFKKKDKRFRIFDLAENKGSGYVRNLGIQKAKGNYVLFLDADVYFSKNAFEKLANSIVKNTKIDIFLWGFSTFQLGKKKQKETIPQKLEKSKVETPLRTVMTSQKGFIAPTWVYIVKRLFIKKYDLHFSEGIYFEDIVFTTSLLCYAKKVIVLPFVGYHYRKHKTSVTGKTSPQKIFDKFTAFDHLKIFLKERRVYSQYEQLYIARFLTFCVFTCFTEYFSLSKKERNPLLDDYMLRIRKSA